MVSVFLSHSSKDKPFARDLADSLGRGGEIKVWLDEREIAPGTNIVGAIQQGLDSDFILLILSPDSVNSNWVKEEWTDAFWEQTNNRKTKLLGVLYRDCVIPRLLRNKKYFDLRTNQLDGFRQIHTFLLTQQPLVPQRVNQLPPRPANFIGRELELAELRRRLSEPAALVYLAEMAGRGKTMLAREFAHRHQHDYQAVYWLSCERASLATIASDLERQLDLKIDGDLPKLLRDVKDACSRKRCLLVLDNVETEETAQLLPGGVASVLLTTRRKDFRFLRGYQPLTVPEFTEAECFALFRSQLGHHEVSKAETDCRKLFKRIGYSPFGVSVAAALIREDVRYTISGLAQEIPDDVKELIRKASNALEAEPRKLLDAMAACAPQGFAFHLATEVAGFEQKASLVALQGLHARSLVEELDRGERKYRLHALVRESADGSGFAQRHAQAVNARFTAWQENWSACEKLLPDFQTAFEWALPQQWTEIQWFAYRGYALTKRIGRPAEAFEICDRMAQLARTQQNDADLQRWIGNQALILQAWGRLEEALALHKKQEEICVQLGNQDSLQASYGNQALILKAWGRLEEALALHKKEEEICVQLGNQDGLQRSYGNQALILKAWGRLEEALALHKKEEEICVQLGNQDGLQRSYGNQALILKAWGRLEEALALHKKQEEICVQLGIQDGLQASYGNQALILQAWGRLEEALALHKKQEEICGQLGNQDGLAISYGNQALILQAWGRLEEALALHKKQEEICVQLGNQDSLQASYGNQALILQAWGRLEEALALHKKKEEICVQLGNQDSLGTSYHNQADILRDTGKLVEAAALYKKEEAIYRNLGSKEGLGYCYWSVGVLEGKRGNRQAAREKLTAALALFTELQMPRERDAVQVELEQSKAAGAG